MSDHGKNEILQEEHSKWDDLYNSTEYKTLVQKKRRFIIPALVFFTVYYVLLLVIQGYFPSFASTPVVGSLNIGYLFAVSQLPVAWILCYCFIRYSQGLDDLGKRVHEKSAHLEKQPQRNTRIAMEGKSHTL
jgi:uncharacterized membrane protein (DUF485 family)